MPISNFINNFKNMWVGTEPAFIENVIPPIISGNGIPFNLENSDNISTVYTCIKILADNLARLPVSPYSDKGSGRTTDKEHYLYPILHYNPNPWTSQQTFFSALEYWRNLKGNAFAKINRNPDGTIYSLVLIPPSRIGGYAVENNELYYDINLDDGTIERINASEVLHFRSLTKDGIWGINPLEALRLNLSSSWQGHQMIDSFYKNNTMSPHALKSVSAGSNQKAMLEMMEQWYIKYGGAANAGKIVPLPPNTDLVDLALNFADAELIGTLKFNAQQIAALYGVPPHMVGIIEATKFASVEAQGLDFKATTLAAIARMYRQELEFKLLTTKERLNGVSIEFNFESLVEVDSTTRITNLKTLASLGVISVNDIAKLEGWPTYADGNLHMVPGNYIPMEQIANKKYEPTQTKGPEPEPTT